MVMPMGVCYGPYHQKDKPWSSYTSADINGDMIIIAKYFNHIRPYSMQDAGKYIVGAASNHKIRVQSWSLDLQGRLESNSTGNRYCHWPSGWFPRHSHTLGRW